MVGNWMKARIRFTPVQGKNAKEAFRGHVQVTYVSEFAELDGLWTIALEFEAVDMAPDWTVQGHVRMFVDDENLKALVPGRTFKILAGIRPVGEVDVLERDPAHATKWL